MPTPDGKVAPQSTVYDDYREVDGILFPFVIKVPMGPQLLDFHIKQIQVNPNISDSDFN